jgi:hypothetical protein
LQAQMRDQTQSLKSYMETSLEAVQRELGGKAEKKGTLQ